MWRFTGVATKAKRFKKRLSSPLWNINTVMPRWCPRCNCIKKAEVNWRLKCNDSMLMVTLMMCTLMVMDSDSNWFEANAAKRKTSERISPSSLLREGTCNRTELEVPNTRCVGKHRWCAVGLDDKEILSLKSQLCNTRLPFFCSKISEGISSNYTMISDFQDNMSTLNSFLG